MQNVTYEAYSFVMLLGPIVITLSIVKTEQHRVHTRLALRYSYRKRISFNAAMMGTDIDTAYMSWVLHLSGLEVEENACQHTPNVIIT